MAGAEPVNESVNVGRAEFNYMMHCQGCHTPDGIGGAEVPRMKDFIGHFTRTGQGRAYLVRVPGAAYSVLDDEKLAEVLNWIVLKYAGESLPMDFVPYNAEEVGEYRSQPLAEVVEYRKRTLLQIAVELQDPEVMLQ
jgi:mono/diheme cytochrome c family protein